MSHRAEFDRQVQNLVDRGYPALVGTSEEAFREALLRLAPALDTVPHGTAVAADEHIPFVVVVNRAPVADGKAPKLGWCWDGNPHTWLGSASAGARVGAVGA